MSRDVPLPFYWNNFTAQSENKADLVMFLFRELIRLAPDNNTIVVGGGFLEEQQVRSNKHIHNLNSLRETRGSRHPPHAACNPL